MLLNEVGYRFPSSRLSLKFQYIACSPDMVDSCCKKASHNLLSNPSNVLGKYILCPFLKTIGFTGDIKPCRDGVPYVPHICTSKEKVFKSFLPLVAHITCSVNFREVIFQSCADRKLLLEEEPGYERVPGNGCFRPYEFCPVTSSILKGQVPFVPRAN